MWYWIGLCAPSRNARPDAGPPRRSAAAAGPVPPISGAAAAAERDQQRRSGQRQAARLRHVGRDVVERKPARARKADLGELGPAAVQRQVAGTRQVDGERGDLHAVKQAADEQGAGAEAEILGQRIEGLQAEQATAFAAERERRGVEAAKHRVIQRQKARGRPADDEARLVIAGDVGGVVDVDQARVVKGEQAGMRSAAAAQGGSDCSGTNEARQE
mmetsp:Transcript_50524/g.123214  ORF Transcript_50524/g.123214 Transcript_50524/m.123214 type:complete len:216 (+) Transcript_50524:1-648(+)